MYVVGKKLALCAVAKDGWVVPRSQNDQKRANFQLKKSGACDLISQRILPIEIPSDR